MAITADVKLSVYNAALRILGERRLASLSENREPRRVLDDIWTDAVNYALERGDWNFAIRAVKGVYDANVETDFGYRRAYEKPSDITRLSALSGDEYFRVPLTHAQFVDEGGYWLSDLDELYIRYVSNDDAYGFNSGGWSESFKKYLAAYLARESCERITNSRTKKADAEAGMRDALKQAKSHDTMGEGVKFPPQGSWAAAKGGRVRREGSRLR